MAILLGKDATINVGGAVAGVRNVTWSETARTIDVEEYGSKYKTVYSTGYEVTVSMELNDNGSLNGFFSNLQSGSEVSVSGGGGGWSIQAVVTSIQETDSIDGVVTYQIECRMTRPGLRGS